MSLPTLSIYLCSNATLADVGDFLGVDMSQADRLGNDPRHDHFHVRQPIGHLQLSYNSQTGLDFGDYAHEWNLIINLDIPKESGWGGIRLLIALELCKALHERFGGVYLGLYDTGSASFYLKDAVLWLPEENEEHFARFPLFRGRVLYKKLEPV